MKASNPCDNKKQRRSAVSYRQKAIIWRYRSKYVYPPMWRVAFQHFGAWRVLISSPACDLGNALKVPTLNNGKIMWTYFGV